MTRLNYIQNVMHKPFLWTFAHFPTVTVTVVLSFKISKLFKICFFRQTVKNKALNPTLPPKENSKRGSPDVQEDLELKVQMPMKKLHPEIQVVVFHLNSAAINQPIQRPQRLRPRMKGQAERPKKRPQCT